MVLASEIAERMEANQLAAIQGWYACDPTSGCPTTDTPSGKPGPSAQELLHKGHEARRSGDLAKARGLYVAALSRNPGDSEALAGLAETSKAEGDRAGAASFYKSAIAVNPNYLPSQVGLADLLWESGDRVEAQRRYQTVVDKFPSTIVPDRARQRALQ